jgi:CDP-6-deoxy-D-xylo-4-hexulose-3-dehydrase
MRLREEIKKLLKNKPKISRVTVGWPVYDESEVEAVLKTLLAGQVSFGKKVKEFEENFASYIGQKFAVAVNSGSSANLLALLTLLESGEIKRGDKVIVPASTFITAATPIVQLGLIPLFVDVETSSYNIDPEEIEKAASKAKAVIVVHSLGNPAKISEIKRVARKFKLKIIEDCCEAHGAEIGGQKVGSFGDLATFSFFVAHNITMGEGGLVLTNNEDYVRILKSLRDFGRAEQSKGRFQVDSSFGEYDSRYLFERLGYNFRLTEMQAAFGLEQLKKLDKLNNIRRQNARFYTENLKKFSEFLDLPQENGFHTYYAYPVTIKETAGFERKELVEYLEKNGIETRPFFAGFIPEQPAFKNQRYLLSGKMSSSRLIKEKSFFIGVHPALNKKQLEKVVKTFDKFFAEKNSSRKSSKPKISCILISFNKPYYLPEAIESVLNQTYQDFEIVLIDGGSTEKGMKEVLQKYSSHPKIRLFYTGETEKDRKEKAMLSVSANLGIKKAKGELITYLCDDDIYLPKRFEKMVAFFEENKDAKVVYSWQRAYNYDLSGKKTNIHVRKLSGKRGQAAKPYLPLDRFIDVNSFMHYKSCLTKLKKPYWPENKETQGHNDGIFAEKLGERFVFHPINEVLDEHRYTPKSLNYKQVNKPHMVARIVLNRFLGKGKGLKIDI